MTLTQKKWERAIDEIEYKSVSKSDNATPESRQHNQNWSKERDWISYDRDRKKDVNTMIMRMRTIDWDHEIYIRSMRGDWILLCKRSR